MHKDRSLETGACGCRVTARPRTGLIVNAVYRTASEKGLIITVVVNMSSDTRSGKDFRVKDKGKARLQRGFRSSLYDFGGVT